MQDYQRDFIALAIEHEVLCFGEYTLKSGRISPYFFNAGKFYTGHALASLGRFYAQALMDAKLDVDVIFGPAYKGIALATTTAATLASQHEYACDFAYNRKEAKQHGEGGTLVGAPLNGNILVVDDVITAGTAIGEAAELIQAQHAHLAGVLIGLDRQERGKGTLSAVQEVEEKFSIPVISIINMGHIIEYLESQSRHELVEKMAQYRNTYGIA